MENAETVDEDGLCHLDDFAILRVGFLTLRPGDFQEIVNLSHAVNATNRLLSHLLLEVARDNSVKSHLPIVSFASKPLTNEMRSLHDRFAGSLSELICYGVWRIRHSLPCTFGED